MTALLLWLVVAMPTCTTADPALERLIQQKAAELDGNEYCQFRMYDALSDLDGDLNPDFVVIFTVEGLVRGKSDVQFLAIFPSRPGATPIATEIGRRGSRVITALEVSPPDIVLRALEYEVDDAICCPGDPVLLGYRLACEGVQQVNHSSRKPHKHPPGRCAVRHAQESASLEVPSNNGLKLTASRWQTDARPQLSPVLGRRGSPLTGCVGDLMALFTTILDYRGGTYIQQVSATGRSRLYESGPKNSTLPAVSGLGLRGGLELARAVADDELVPTPVAGVASVWCIGTLLCDSLALVNLVQTESGVKARPNKRMQRRRPAQAKKPRR